MSVQFAQVLQAALGVVSAIPSERRAAMADECLIHLASTHGFAPAPATRRDEVWEAAADVLSRVEKLYHEGRLDAMLCGLPASSPGAEPLNLIDRSASRVTVGIGRDNYRAMVVACLEALSRWVRANPGVDIDHQPTTKVGWELALDRPLLGDLDAPSNRRSMSRSLGEVAPGQLAAIETGASAVEGTDWTQRVFTGGL